MLGRTCSRPLSLSYLRASSITVCHGITTNKAVYTEPLSFYAPHLPILQLLQLPSLLRASDEVNVQRDPGTSDCLLARA